MPIWSASASVAWTTIGRPTSGYLGQKRYERQVDGRVGLSEKWLQCGRDMSRADAKAALERRRPPPAQVDSDAAVGPLRRPRLS